MIRHLAFAQCALAIGALIPASASAQAPGMTAQSTSEASLREAASPTAIENPFATAALDDSTLRGIAGREDVQQISQADLVAGVSRNTVGDNSVTGDARIDGNAFQNMSGLSILSVNTGNNVAMNAAMNVNVSIQQGQ